jgi:hydroxymethylpyrimidine pyrophosphatase-like HAD family hydrolase
MKGQKKPMIETRQNTTEPKSIQQLSKQFAQLQREGLVITENGKKVIDKKSGSVIFRNSFESKSSSLTKCLNDLRRKNKDANFDTVLIQNTMGYDRVCTATGKVMETGKNIQAQEIMLYVKGELKGLGQKYTELKGKQIQVNNYTNGSIHYTRHPSVINSQRAAEINQVLQITQSNKSKSTTK